MKKKVIIIISSVIIIVGLLALIPTNSNRKYKRDPRAAYAKNDLRVIEAGYEYSVSNKNIIPSLGDRIVSELYENGILKKNFIDPWGNNYQLIQNSSSNIVIMSFGSDGELGTKDDLKLEITPNQRVDFTVTTSVDKVKFMSTESHP